MKKGHIYLYTGDGKGKTTASLGVALRASGYGKKTLILQFVKDPKWTSGERDAISKIPNIDIKALGKGFVGIRGDRHEFEEHKEAAKTALKESERHMLSGQYDILVLDEINVALKLGLLEMDEVLKFLDKKPEELNLILTGRDADPIVMERADLISEVKMVKHYYKDKGCAAIKGIEY